MKPLFERINSYITTHTLIPAQSTIILGLSGGPDSVFLAHVLTNLQNKGLCRVIAAHLNHQWRTDSANDVQFCQGLAQKLGIGFVSTSIDNLSLSPKFNGSQEEVGRAMRRHFFEQTKKEYGAHAIALAHHADDQQETFFIRLLRGTSLTGLTGMKPKHGSYIRPLLDISKAEIIDYLESHDIAYLVDPTNESDAYLRNRIRNHIIPACKATDERFATNFGATLSRLQETEQFLVQLTEKQFNSLQTSYGINLNQFLNLDPLLQHRILVHWLCQEKVSFPVSQAFLDELLRFLSHPTPGTHQVSPTWRLVKNGSFARIDAQVK